MTFEDVLREASIFSGWKLETTLRSGTGVSVELTLEQPDQSDSRMVLLWHPHSGLREVRLRLRFWGFTPEMIEVLKAHMEAFRTNT